jgi:hypothetical protein
MIAAAKYAEIVGLLKDAHGEWREIDSCADFVQDVTLIVARGTPAARRAPSIHFAKRSDAAAEAVAMGEAICGAGLPSRTEGEQYVTAIYDDVTCANCRRIVDADVAREQANACPACFRFAGSNPTCPTCKEHRLLHLDQRQRPRARRGK